MPRQPASPWSPWGARRRGRRRPALPPETPGAAHRPHHRLCWLDADTVYLSPAPLYHTAPLGYTHGRARPSAARSCVMEHFDPERLLARHRAPPGDPRQLVPTMFVRLLKLLPERPAPAVRPVVAAGSPSTPPRRARSPVKEQMLEWWGPIVHEYYGGTEGNGVTYVEPAGMADPSGHGRRGRSSAPCTSCDEAGDEVPAGEDGLVYFERPRRPFEYHKDEPGRPVALRTRCTRGWTALGDIGHVDADGFLYLTDRASFMIITRRRERVPAGDRGLPRDAPEGRRRGRDRRPRRG